MNVQAQYWKLFVERLRTDDSYFAKYSKKMFGNVTIKDNGCWEYGGYIGQNGYGCVTPFNGPGPFPAHRVAFALANRDFGWNGDHICHHCDNPPCINPLHLFPGTMKINIEDCIFKGRFKFIKPRRGETHPQSKLSEEAVRFIIDNFRPKTYVGQWTRASLAKRFGVAPATIYRIANGRAWAHKGGTKNLGNSHLTEEQKAIIRKEHTPGVSFGPGTRSSLAKKLGVPPHAVSNYITRIHVTEKNNL